MDAFKMTDFIAKVRSLGGFETLDQANAFITDAEIEARGNANMRKVYLALVRARGANYYRSYVEITLEPGTSTYELDASFLELLSVSRKSGDGWVPMFDFGENERHDYDQWGTVEWPVTGLGTPVRFQLQGDNLELVPAPQTADTIRLNFVPAYVPVTKDDDNTFDGVSGFEEWAVWETVAEFQQKDSTDWQLSMAKAAWWEREIESMARQRNASGPRRVNRVRKRRRFGFCP